MRESRAGAFVKGRSPLIEIKAKRTDSYDKFANRITKALQLPCQEGKSLALFKTNGARILNSHKPWSLGNYLLMLKKGASNIKIGVAFVDDDHIACQVCSYLYAYSY